MRICELTVLINYDETQHSAEDVKTTVYDILSAHELIVNVDVKDDYEYTIGD